ncbi:MAG TPA: hypothetical protein VGS96_00185 [Thermoanaerobaculia bacterium]|jgi:hypothetical protein|nr:hypothetical protein [Thermoanaerobaculia bacterium]
MKTLDGLIAEMYDSICFEKGARPDWRRNDRIYAPGARLVRINDAGVFEFDLQSYRVNFEAMIDSGEMPSFWEGELWRETRQFGDMAHVLSAYETRRSREGELLNRGVNSIQAFQRGGRWWISAMIWRREGREVRIEDHPTHDDGGETNRFRQ